MFIESKPRLSFTNFVNLDFVTELLSYLMKIHNLIISIYFLLFFKIHNSIILGNSAENSLTTCSLLNAIFDPTSVPYLF